MQYAPSFYYADRPVAESGEGADSVASSIPNEDMPTAIEFTPPAVAMAPVFSCYIQPGMATPAYNTIQEKAATPAELSLPAEEAPEAAAVALTDSKKSKEPSQEPPSFYSWPTDAKDQFQPAAKEYKYKESIYMGFKNDVHLIHGRDSIHSTEKTPATVEEKIPEQPKHDQPKPITGSRLVKSVKIVEPQQQPKVYKEYSTVEGDAFRPVAAASEYHFGQLNDLVSYVNIKQ